MMAEKLKLIDVDLLSQLLSQRGGGGGNPLPPADPTLRELNTIENKINTTLTNKSSPAQIAEVNNLITKHNIFQNNYENAVTGPPIPTVPTTKAKTEEDWLNRTIEAAPPTHRRKIRGLLMHIIRSPNLSWDSDGRIIRDGQAVDGTNILDLAHSMVRPRTSFRPVGVENFINDLMMSNAPLEFIGNAQNLLKTTPMQRAKLTIQPGRGRARVRFLTPRVVGSPAKEASNKGAGRKRKADWLQTPGRRTPRLTRSRVRTPSTARGRFSPMAPPPSPTVARSRPADPGFPLPFPDWEIFQTDV